VTSDLACLERRAWKDAIVPKPYPKEFRDDVVRVAENREPGVTIERIAADFGVHPMTLTKWLARFRAEKTAAETRAPSPGDRDAEVRGLRQRTGCWSRRWRCSDVRRRICRRRISREKALPARERARR
jgi:transposase-like protein